MNNNYQFPGSGSAGNKAFQYLSQRKPGEQSFDFSSRNDCFQQSATDLNDVTKFLNLDENYDQKLDQQDHNFSIKNEDQFYYDNYIKNVGNQLQNQLSTSFDCQIKEETVQSIQNPQLANILFNQLYQQLPINLQESGLNQQIVNKMVEKNKRTIKREKAKQRKNQGSKLDQMKDTNSEYESSSTIVKADIISSGKGQQVPQIIDQKNQKKMQQMIRNRISAQNSRDRKKQYIGKLEQDNQYFQQENISLQAELDTLKQDGLAMKHQNTSLRQKLEELQKKYKNTKNFVCNNCGRNNISFNENFFSEPSNQQALAEINRQHSSNSSPTSSSSCNRSYAGLGLAFFTLLSVFLLFNNSTNKQQGSGEQSIFLSQQQVQQQQIQQQIDAIIKNQQMQNDKALQNLIIESIDKNNQDYEVLQSIVKLKQHQLLDQTKQQIKIEQEEEELKVNQNNLIESNQYTSNQFCKEGNTSQQQQPILTTQDKKISSIFCPSMFSFKEKEDLNSQININGNDQLVQLIIPKKNFKAFTGGKNNDILVAKLPALESDNSMIIIQANIHDIKEVPEINLMA